MAVRRDSLSREDGSMAPYPIKSPYGLHLLPYYEAVLMFVTTATLLIMIVPYDKKAQAAHGELWIVGIGLPIIIIWGVLAIRHIYFAFRDMNPKPMLFYLVWKIASIGLFIGESVYHAIHAWSSSQEQVIIETVLKIGPCFVLLFAIFTLVVGVRITLFIADHARVNKLAYKTPAKF